MKHCQSQPVSYKVGWFCSLAGFSWWSAPFLFFSFSLSLSLQMLFPAVLFFFAHPFSEEQRKGCGGGPGGEGCIITANYSCVCTDALPAADFPALFHRRTIRYLHLLLLYLFFFLSSFKQKKRKHQFFLFLSSRAQTVTLAG